MKVFQIEWHSPYYDRKEKFFDKITDALAYLSDTKGFDSEFRETAFNLWDNYKEDYTGMNWENYHEFKGLYSGLTFAVFEIGFDSLDEFVKSTEELTSFTHDSLYHALNRINFGWDEGYISNDLAKSLTKYYSELFVRLN